MPQLLGWVVYILRCSDRRRGSTFYTGITNDLEARVKKHNAGKGAKYTKSRLPVVVHHFVRVPSKSAALKLEAKIKKKTRAQKVAFMSGDKTREEKIEHAQTEEAARGWIICCRCGAWWKNTPHRGNWTEKCYVRCDGHFGCKDCGEGYSPWPGTGEREVVRAARLKSREGES